MMMCGRVAWKSHSKDPISDLMVGTNFVFNLKVMVMME